jgi:hypothetical protein
LGWCPRQSSRSHAVLVSVALADEVALRVIVARMRESIA